MWVTMVTSGLDLPGALRGAAWHSHEMIFGYLAAIIAGFILTAIPNWTGRLPVQGAGLAVLLAAWIAGRVAVVLSPWPLVTLFIDAAFLVLLAAVLWRELVAGGTWRNVPVCILITLLAAANILTHFGQSVENLAGLGERLALGAAALLMGLIGGRIVPSFTRNWMARLQIDPKPVPFGRFDQFVLLIGAVGLACWIVAPTSRISGALLVAGGILHLLRLSRWRGDKTLREPIVAILHLGYLWLSSAFLAIGGAIFLPGVMEPSASLHVLTAGAIGTMTLAIMTRATLGHTGREVRADGVTLTIYGLVTVGAVARAAAPYLPIDQVWVVDLAGLAWGAAFPLFAFAYGLLLWRRQ